VAGAAGVHVVEDAAQAHGARRDGHRAGSRGVAACFSFYPGKNLGALGDAGAVVTSDAALAERIRALANHGRSNGSGHYEHGYVGTNSRLDTLQAIALTAKLQRLDEWTDARIALADGYRKRLAGTAVRLTGAADGVRHVYHLMVARVPGRERVREALHRRGVQTGVHYPVPCHRQPPLRRYARGPLPVCEEAARTQFSLPLHPYLTEPQLDLVCTVLGEAVRDAG
jgi:dTDP-4-amino-4,6-dideoxygalactose transaminase